jgi:amidohydrolase
MPHQTVDPTVAAAQIISTLQTIVSRNISPLEQAVVSVGYMHAGTAANIIPPEVDLGGTIRTYIAEVRDLVFRRLREVADGVAAACGAQAMVEFTEGTLAVVNDATVTEIVRASAEQLVGSENVITGHRTMGSEDASFFMKDVPGCYFFLGAANSARGLDAPHHNPRFDIDEDALPVGVAIMAASLAHYLL